jgi:hypothetical protein
LAWLRPDKELFRVLLLMPLWGAWSMLITVQWCHAGDGTEPAVAAFARGCRPMAMAGALAAILILTIQYFTFLPWTHLAVAGASIVAAALAGPVMCRATRGLTRRALLAANLLTQLVFLLSYVGIRNMLIW